MEQQNSFSNILLSKIPYSWRIIDSISELNPKYEDFNDLTKSKDERIFQQSVLQALPQSDNISDLGGILANKTYHKYMYAGIDMDKIRRLQDYRRMAAFAEVSDAIDEICDECIVKDENDNVINFDLKGAFDKGVRKEIQKEWDKFSNHFDLEHNGWELYRQFLIDGEIFFENIISRNRPDYGILGVVNIPPAMINPIYDNVQNGYIKGFLLRRPVRDPEKQHQKKEEIILLDKNQVIYISSGIWNEDRSIRLPYIENCRRAYKQLSLIEDSIIIYRLVRAPERLVFKVDVGNMPPPKAEAYIKRLMQQYWSRKSYDAHSKTVTNVYDPQSMLDSYWFPKRGDKESTEVSTLPGGANLGQLDDLLYFQKKLYKSLKVPLGRLNQDDPFKDGSEITREELRFARFVMRVQSQFALGIRDGFMTHLKLRGLWKQHELKECNIKIAFNIPTQFMAMRDQQLLNIKWENYNNFSSNELISHSYAQRHYLDWTDEQMAENREWLRKDNALMWEIEQIHTMGPDFRDQQNAMAQAASDMGGIPAGGGSSTLPPEFGPSPSEMGGETTPEAPAATPEAPAATPEAPAA